VRTLVFYQGTTKELAEKLISVEGDGLEAVHNCFEMNSALAAEGIPSPQKLGFSPTHYKIVILRACDFFVFSCLCTPNRIFAPSTKIVILKDDDFVVSWRETEFFRKL
jgi:hypothetical protein